VAGNRLSIKSSVAVYIVADKIIARTGSTTSFHAPDEPLVLFFAILDWKENVTDDAACERGIKEDEVCI
jgi:hypothetical protein